MAPSLPNPVHVALSRSAQAVGQIEVAMMRNSRRPCRSICTRQNRRKSQEPPRRLPMGYPLCPLVLPRTGHSERAPACPQRAASVELLELIRAAGLRTFWPVEGHTIWSGQRKKQRAPTNAGALVFTKKKKGSIACRGAPVEAVIDPALHHVDLFGGAYERRAEDTRGEGDTIDANVGVTEVKVLVFDLG